MQYVMLSCLDSQLLSVVLMVLTSSDRDGQQWGLNSVHFTDM